MVCINLIEEAVEFRAVDGYVCILESYLKLIAIESSIVVLVDTLEKAP